MGPSVPNSPRIPGSLPKATTQTAGSEAQHVAGTPLMHRHNEPAFSTDMRDQVVIHGYSRNSDSQNPALHTTYCISLRIMHNVFTISPLLQVVALLMGWVLLLSTMTIMCHGFTVGPLLQVVAPLMGWVRNYHGYQFFDCRL